MRPVHTPYDGSSTPFTIGLRPLEPGEWIEVGEDLEAMLAEKDRLAAAGAEVFAAEPGTDDAQREVLALLVDHLPFRFPQIYRRRRDLMEIGRDGRRIDLAAACAPLLTAAQLVPEDLLLMRRSQAGWRLAAASLSFPSSWSLAEKFGRPLAEIHAPVPGFAAGTRNAVLIERMFDRLQGQAVQRLNWSLQSDGAFHKPLSSHGRLERAGAPRFPGDDPAADAFMRVERQTLRKLPASGDILFTIRIHLDPVAVLRAHPDRSVAAAFAGQLAALDAGQLGYKGLQADRDRLIRALRAIAEGNGAP